MNRVTKTALVLQAGMLLALTLVVMHLTDRVLYLERELQGLATMTGWLRTCVEFGMRLR